MAAESSGRYMRAYPKGAVDWRKATEYCSGPKPVMLLGDSGTWDDRHRVIEKIEHFSIHGERIRERQGNRRRKRLQANR